MREEGLIAAAVQPHVHLIGDKCQKSQSCKFGLKETLWSKAFLYKRQSLALLIPPVFRQESNISKSAASGHNFRSITLLAF